jgi:hypothetical protein
MPYGISNESSKDVAWMESCILSVRKQNPSYDKEKCIRICKATLLRDRSLSSEERKGEARVLLPGKQVKGVHR